jgi:hypothetical protein
MKNINYALEDLNISTKRDYYHQIKWQVLQKQAIIESGLYTNKEDYNRFVKRCEEMVIECAILEKELGIESAPKTYQEFIEQSNKILDNDINELFGNSEQLKKEK